MKSVKYARRASSDLEDITDYTAQAWGSEKAKKYTKDIRVKMEEIVKGEASIQPMDVGRAGMFKARVNRPLIIFEQTDKHILIIRILHEAMDVPRHIGPPH